MGMDGRKAALRALGAWRRAGTWPEAEPGLDRREAGLATGLIAGTLQNLAYLDFCIGRYASVSTRRMQPQVLDILRLSVYQLFFMDRIPVHAAVSEGVALCRTAGCPRAAGLVNAVLRRAAEDRAHPPAVPGEGTAEYLALRYSHPLWLVRELTETRGCAFAEAFLRANNEIPPLCVQTNTLKTDAGTLSARFASQGVTSEPGLLPGSLHLRDAGPVTALPGFDEGLFYVQDDGARRAAETAGARPGMNVLDACAAPGGKSFAAALAMGDAGRVLSCDVSEKKLARISEGAARLGLSCIGTRVMDARRPGEDLLGWADTVIADAPCSGLGVIRRKPEIRYKPEAELDGLPRVQEDILSGLAGCVRPGGTLLYATCTVRVRENEDVVRAFLEKHGEFTPAESETLWPQIHKTDGFFICKLIKST